MLGATASVVPGAILMHPLVAVVSVDIVPLSRTQLVKLVSTRVP